MTGPQLLLSFPYGCGMFVVVVYVPLYARRLGTYLSFQIGGLDSGVG